MKLLIKFLLFTLLIVFSCTRKHLKRRDVASVGFLNEFYTELLNKYNDGTKAAIDILMYYINRDLVSEYIKNRMDGIIKDIGYQGEYDTCEDAEKLLINFGFTVVSERSARERAIQLFKNNNRYMEGLQLNTKKMIENLNDSSKNALDFSEKIRQISMGEVETPDFAELGISLTFSVVPLAIESFSSSYLRNVTTENIKKSLEMNRNPDIAIGKAYLEKYGRGFDYGKGFVALAQKNLCSALRFQNKLGEIGKSPKEETVKNSQKKLRRGKIFREI